jgi:hypothetical protein
MIYLVLALQLQDLSLGENQSHGGRGKRTGVQWGNWSWTQGKIKNLERTIKQS